MTRKKKKGFTLVELIVTIAIIGVILIIALPQIRNIQSANKDRKFELYKESILAGSKLYIDAYSKDVFGENTSGCIRIKYSELKEKNLIKDFSSKEITCSNDDETFVEVRKVLEEYKYKINVTCKNKKTNKEVYKLVQITGPLDSCSHDPDLKAPQVELAPTSSNNKWYNAKDLKVKIKVSDASGLNSNISLKYQWYNKTTAQVTTSGSHNFKNKKGIEALTYTIPISNNPQDAGGKYKLTVLPDDKAGNGIQDALGNKTLTTTSAEEYWIDNEKPKFNATRIVSADSTFASKQVLLQLDASDNFTPTTDLKVYISNSGYQTGGTWQNYNATINWTVTGNYDGKNRTIYVSLKDLAGNIEQKSFTYTIYKECSSHIDDGAWYDSGTCSKKCGGGKVTQLKNQKDKYLKTTCPAISQEAPCNEMTCCSKVRYEDGDNCSATCGGGTKNQVAYSVYDGSRCSSDDKSSGGAACNKQDCCSQTVAGTWSSWGGCSASCGGGTRSRYRYRYSIYNNQYCSTEYDTGSCNTHSCVPVNNCNIRGSRIVYPGYGWTCSGGHYHTSAYTHYCTDGAGNLYTKDTNPGLVTYRWVCPSSPYGPAQGWTVIND